MDRKKLFSKLIEEAKIAKYSQETLGQNSEDLSKGNEIAEQVFDKLLNELDFESLD